MSQLLLRRRLNPASTERRVPAGSTTAYDRDMEFRILGPLEVEDQGRKLPLGGPAERHLLAVLLCLANEPVSMHRLIDELWADDPPSSARNIVQQYISHLRRTLEDETRLTTQPGGYVLRVDKDELDWDRFRALVHRTQATDNHGHSAALLREAIAMWRGTALSGAGDGPTVTAERVRLEEARLAATEDRIDCELELGKHCEVTAELESLVAQHPQRERLLGQLMLALYRCNRQPEALHRFEEYRRQMGEETGLEPSAALTALEAKILTDDSELGMPPHNERTPSNLPQRLSSFVGRETEIDTVAHRLSGHRLVTLTGTGGIGKTSLGIRVAAELADAFPDGIWWLDLAPLTEGTLIPGTAAGVIGASLGQRQDPLAAVVDHLRDQMALIALDNCEHLIDGAAEFAQSILLAAPDVSILATSREPLGVAGEALMRVPSLTLPDDGGVATSEAVRLFVDRAKLLDPEFRLADANSEHIATICRQLDGIPLAIELAAARMSTMALDQIADGIGDRYELLTRGARTAPRRHRTLRALVDWSHDLLTVEERVVFRRLGAFAGSFTAAAAKYTCGFEPLAEDDVPQCLDQLVDASLVEPPEPSSDRFQMLETVRVYAAEELEAGRETTPTMRRLAEHLNEHGPNSEEGYPVSDYEAWYAWRDDEQANFRRVFAWALTARDPDVAASTAIEFRNYLAIGNLADETVALVDGVLELLGDEKSHRHLRLFSFAVINEAFLGDRKKARRLAEALQDQAQALGEKGVAGFALQIQSMDEMRRGNVEGALDLNAQSIAQLRAANDLRAPDQMWVRAFVLARTGRFDEARSTLDEMLALARQMGERYDNRFAEAFWNIGTAVVAAYEGDAAEAERMLDAEDEYVHHLGPDDLVGYTWGRWQVAFLNDDAAQAEAVAREIDEVTPSSAGPDRRRDIAYMLALPALALRGPDAARPHLCDALQLAHEDGMVIDLAEIVTVVAESALLADDLEVAATLYAAATSILDGFRIVVSPWQRKRIDESINDARQLLDPGRSELVWQRGASMNPDEMVEYAADYLGLELPTRS